jgi:Fe-S cluster assembly ATP-binding protein
MLEIRNVGVQLDDEGGKVQILRDINLTLENKKVYVMTGPNGGGKSSLAKVVMGIYRPSEGEIFLDGVDITHKEIFERAQMGIGYAFQQPARFKGIKVRDFLGLAAGADSSVNPCDLLFDVGLCAMDYLDREINSTFSGGELKRIEIASVLARNLKVAIFDEPEAGIDLWSFQKLVETFENMNNKYDTTIVIISHQERIIRLADQVIIVADGKISSITSQEEILGDIEKLDSDCRCRNNCSRGGRAIAECRR